MNTIYDILSHFRATSFTEKEKGTQFERLMRAWLKTDARYAHLFEHVWLWEEFPSRKDFGGQDTGIDLVAKTHEGDYWAIQCKCYAEDTVIDKAAVDSFLATSSRTFTNEVTFQTTSFAHRLWIATTSHWGSNAEEAIQNQLPPVSRVNLYDLDHSAVDWSKIFLGLEGKAALSEKKQLREHQREALKAAHRHFLSHDRGKLIMACGTGKTFTSLKLIEQELEGKGLVLFLVPSIALLGQSLNDWMGDAETPIKAVCICSDSRASRKIKRGNPNDELETSIVDLALPASTNTESITHQLLSCRAHDGLTVVFSTYQSIDVVAEAQAELLAQTGGEFGVFDFVVCDEAHRTTGVKLSTKDESNFIKIHNDDFIRGRKRLYMTATPRLYGENARIKASKNDCVLCSMDDETLYGQEFYRVNFSYAVQNGILTDYKVLVLTVSEDMIPADLMKQVKDLNAKELNYDDTGRLIGVINGLSKKILGDKGVTWDADPRLMRRALAFTHKIGREDEPGTSRNIEHVLPRVSALYNETLSDEERKNVVHICARHVDGSMGATERNAALAWLAEETDDPQECRVVTNVRCLSEGVDVPALDAVLFLSARNSQVDVVQSVGRVMRSFRRGQPDEKKYGYIIIPVIVPEGTPPKKPSTTTRPSPWCGTFSMPSVRTTIISMPTSTPSPSTETRARRSPSACPDWDAPVWEGAHSQATPTTTTTHRKSPIKKLPTSSPSNSVPPSRASLPNSWKNAATGSIGKTGRPKWAKLPRNTSLALRASSRAMGENTPPSSTSLSVPSATTSIPASRPNSASRCSRSISSRAPSSKPSLPTTNL